MFNQISQLKGVEVFMMTNIGNSNKQDTINLLLFDKIVTQ